MSDGLVISTTTDEQAIVSAAAEGDNASARIAAFPMEQESLDGSSVISVESPKSERSLLIQRLVEEHERKFSDRMVDPQSVSEQIASTDQSRGTRASDDDPRKGSPEPDYASPEHPHFQRMQALHKWYGSEKIAEIARPVIEAGIDLAPGIAEQIASLENGPEVLLQLCRDPWAASGIVELNEMSPREAKRAIAQWSRAVAEEESEPAEQIPAPRSKPPAPIRPLGGSSTKSSVPQDEMSYRDYRRIRDAEERNRFRR
jgi:hypothetical protein